MLAFCLRVRIVMLPPHVPQRMSPETSGVRCVQEIVHEHGAEGSGFCVSKHPLHARALDVRAGLGASL